MTSPLRRSVRLLAVGAAAVVMLASAQAAATADYDPNPTPTVHDPTLGPDGVRTTVGACTVVSSSNYLGMSCPRGAVGSLSVHDILQDSPVPDCWDTPLSPAELAALKLTNHLPANAVGTPDPWIVQPDSMASGQQGGTGQPGVPAGQPGGQAGQPGQQGPSPSPAPQQPQQPQQPQKKKEQSWGKPPNPFITRAEADKLNLPDPLPDDPEPPKLYLWRFHLNGLGDADKPLAKALYNAHPTFQPELHEFPSSPDDERCDANHDANMTKLFRVEMGAGNIPDPMAGTSPTAHARVGQWVSFWDVRSKDVNVQVGTDQPERLRARPVQIAIRPLGTGDPEELTCPGIGLQAGPEDQPTIPRKPGDPCWYRFDHSSAQEPDEGYHTQITTSWVAEKSDDGGRTWTQFNNFKKTATGFSVVTEVQALVVY